MAGLLEKTGLCRILRDRKWEDYRSLKQYYRNNNLQEIIIEGSDESAGATPLIADFCADQIIAYLTAKTMVYLRSEIDAVGLDGKKIYVDYLDNAGVIKSAITQLASAAMTGTDVEVPMGFQGITDTVASVNAKVVTLTGLAGTLNQYAGKYMVVYSGDMKGTASLIVSNTLGTPTVLTVADSQSGDLATDIISIQDNFYSDFFRVRSMRSEIEAPTDNCIYICDHNGGNLYGVINDASTEAAINRYTVPIKTSGQDTHYYLGRIQARAPIHAEEAAGFILNVRFTPKQWDANIPIADILQEIEFSEHLDWQPCIELEPKTDVVFYIGDNGTVSTVHLEITILEVDRLTN